MTYSSVEKAIAQSKMKRAISEYVFKVQTKNGERPAQIVMAYGKSPVFVYASCPTIEVHEERPTTKQVDSVHSWESF